MNGATLTVGGPFTHTSGVEAGRDVAWDGTTWQGLDTGLGGYDLNALALSGGILYAGGYFHAAGPVAATNIAAWDGSQLALGGDASGGTPEERRGQGNAAGHAQAAVGGN